MSLLFRSPSRKANRAARLVGLATALACSAAPGFCVAGEAGDGPRTPAKAQATPVPLPRLKPRPQPAKRDDSLGNAGLVEEAATVAPAPAPLPAGFEGKVGSAAPVAAARFEGLAAPGVQVRLRADGSTGPGLRYRWIQTQGPAAELTDADREGARLTVPEGARTLGFLLVVSNETGMDSIPLSIPVEGRAAASTDVNLKADAGDDQIGVVGRQITLNGMRSEPRGKIGYRWIQVGGPPARLKIEEGHVFSFVPTEAGTHRFALVVANGGVISEPDEVQVAVEFPGARAARRGGESRPTSNAVPLPVPVPVPVPASAPDDLAVLVRNALAGLEGGPAAAEGLGQAFDGVAGRMPMFRSYDEAYSEISRRLDAIVPQEPTARARWVERLFAPITARMVDDLRKEGLDLATPAGRASMLNDAQKGRMAEIFRNVGDGSRAVPRPL